MNARHVVAKSALRSVVILISSLKSGFLLFAVCFFLSGTRSSRFFFISCTSLARLLAQAKTCRPRLRISPLTWPALM